MEKVPLLTDHMISYYPHRNPRTIELKILHLMKHFGKFTGYEINIEKQTNYYIQ